MSNPENLLETLRTKRDAARQLADSAPELLGLLKEALGALDLYAAYGWPDRMRVRDRARRLITKATGEQP